MLRMLGPALVLLLSGCSLFGPGTVDIDPGSIDMDGISAATLTLRNTGPSAHSFTIADDANWLRAIPAAGSLAGFQRKEVLLVVDKSSFAPGTARPLEVEPGTYSATLIVQAGDASKTVDLSFRVGTEPTDDACSPSSLGATHARSSIPLPSAFDARPGAPDMEPVPSRVIVRYADPQRLGPQGAPGGTINGVATVVASAYGIEERWPGPGAGVEIARVPSGIDPDAFVAALAADPRVVYAELDRPLYPQVLPNDPALTLQWASCRFGVPAAWDVSTGTPLQGPDAPKTTIAIIDSGVDLDHPDLAASLLPGWDFCPVSSGSTTPCSSVPSEPGGNAVSDGHGTHVAGIAAAVGDDGTGIAGVAWGGTRLLPVKVFDDPGRVTSVSAVACAIYWAFGSTDPATLCDAPPNPNPAAILNLSLGGSGSSPTLDDAIAAATDAGALVFAASGNTEDGSAHEGILMPANAPDAIAVGSVNSNFERSSFSRFDARGGRTVDLMAPGGYLLANRDSIYSTYVVSGGISTYLRLAGTSMATPHAAGIAALVWAQEPNLTAADVRARIASTAHWSPGWTAREYGAGVVCADAALGRATTCAMAP